MMSQEAIESPNMSLSCLCLSDLHGYLPKDIRHRDYDLVILAGDYSGCRQNEEVGWLLNSFKPWVDAIAKDTPVFGVAGNHDRAFQNQIGLVPEMGWTYLQDSGAVFNGLNIWGSPWQPTFHNWAFNLSERELAKKWALIPDNTDILILHGPPRGYGDICSREHGIGYENVGSPSLLRRILAIKPKLVVAGHIHSGHGIYDIDGTVFVSAAIMNEQYVPTYSPIKVLV